MHPVEQGRQGRLIARRSGPAGTGPLSPAVPEPSPRPATPRQAIQTGQAPAAIGPYSQAIQCGDLLFISGQIPIDPTNGEIVGGSIEAQTEQVLRNLQAILEAAGLSFRHVARTTVYLKDFSNFAAMNSVYAAWMPDPPPARATVEVARLPRDVQIEIDAIAVR